MPARFLLLLSLWAYQPVDNGGFLATSLPAVTDLGTLEGGLKHAWSNWTGDHSLRVSLSVSVTLLRPDPPVKSSPESAGPLPPDLAHGVPIPFWRSELARKGEKRYFTFTASPPSSKPKTQDLGYSISIYDGKRGWTLNPAIRAVHVAQGPVPQALPKSDLYGDVIGIGSSAARAKGSFKGDLPYPYRIDEVLASGQYKVREEKASAAGVACTLIERAGLDRIWLDPQRGSAIVQREWHWDIGQPLKIKFTNTDFQRVLDGLWLPARSRIEYYATPQTAPNEVCAVAELTVDEVEVNISDDIFVPKLTARSLVTDVDRQVSWVVPADITTQASFDEVIAKADEYIVPIRQRRLWTRPSTWLMLVLGVLLFAALVAGFWRWRRRAALRGYDAGHGHETRHRRGFTLVELLITILIIAVLIALLLPAIQAARESARRTDCQNNLRQLGLALHAYHGVHNMFPGVVGRVFNYPIAGGESRCHGDWSFYVSLLPFLDQLPLYDRLNFAGRASDPPLVPGFCPGVFGADLQFSGSRCLPEFGTPRHICPNATVAARRLGFLLCPSDGNRPTGPKTNYFVNFGTWRKGHDGGDLEDGLFRYMETGGLPISFSTVTDGPTNTAAFAESVSGSESRDRLGSIFDPTGIFNGTTGPAGATAFRDVCQALNWRTAPIRNIDRSNNTKGRGWVVTSIGSVSSWSSGANLYNHVMPPNGLSCCWDRNAPGDERQDQGIAASSNHPTGVGVVFLDDSVRFINRSIDWQTWYTFGSINGRE